MIQHPAVLALLVAAFGALGAVAASSGVALDVLRGWDLASGARAQLRLERRTRLASTLVRWACALELLSLFLYVRTADAIAPLFTGAMCAAGTLQAGEGGYLALGAKLAGFVGAGAWLVLDHADGQVPDYPLIRPRYRLLLALLPIFAADAGLTLAWFRGLEPEVITSCCGSLFARQGRGPGADLAGLPPLPTAIVTCAVGLAACGAAIGLLRWGRGARALGLLGAQILPIGIAAVIAVLSPHVYELPSHHCPFCLLKGEYRWIGWALYVPLLVGAVAALSAGLLERHRASPSLSAVLPRLQRRLAVAALAGVGGFLAVGAWIVLASSLRS